jgi:IS30 family transposase
VREIARRLGRSPLTISRELTRNAATRGGRLAYRASELQTDLETWLDYYSNERTHQGRMCCGRTPMETLLEGKTIWKEKFVA